VDKAQSRLTLLAGRRSSPWWKALLLVAFLAAASGCEALPWAAAPRVGLPSDTPPVAPLLDEAQPTTAAEGTRRSPESSAGEVGAQPNLLRLWLPPQFDPDADTPAASVLRARLDQFSARYPGVRLEIRLKAENGPGGMLAALSAANASAPLTLPDVVALPRPLLEMAALKGVVYPMDGLPMAEVDGFLTEPDWYPFAVQLGRLQENTFGLPFASDLLLVASQPPVEEDSLQSEAALQPTATFEPGVSEPDLPGVWSQWFESGTTLAFPAADPQALFTLLLYRSLGGEWVDEEGRPTLDAAPLEQVLALYQQASQAQVLPFWLSQYETDAQVWQVFEDGEADQLVAWASQVLAASSQAQAPLAARPLPTLDGQPYTLATGWVWAVASPNPEKRALAGELAAFLVDGGFLAEWNAAAGYLPPRRSALESWQPEAWRALVDEIAPAAELLPPGDVLAVLGPPLRQAAVDVLKLQVAPAAAAQAAVAALGAP
jgi:multiple sugar transport system substrate-binding protein